MKLEMQKTPLYIVGAAIVLAFLPWMGLPAFYDSLLYLVLHWIVLALSWNILSGYSGYFSFGHNAFFGTGIYASATLMDKFGWPFLATLPVAAGVACIIGLVVGVIVFRVRGIRGEVFALLTLAVTFVISTIIVNTPIDGGNGVMLSADVPAIGPRASATFYLLALAAATLAMLVAWRVATSKLGAGLFAIHDDEDAAEVMGVPTYRYKLYALAITSSLAGLAGGIHALFLSYVTPDAVFTISVPLTVILMSVLGGTRHWAGPVVGAVAITLLMYSFTAADHAVAGKAMIGVILVAAILFMPNGILGFVLKRKKASTSGGAKGAAHAAPDDKAASTVVAMPARASNEDKLAKAPILLEVRGLRKSFRGLRALDGVDLTVRQGEILGLLGPNGSGKSTFINVISGHFPATAGQVIFEGRDITELPAHDIAHSGIARTYQIPRPFAHMTALQNVALVAMFGNSALTQAEAEREAMQWLEFTGLQDRAHVLPDDLNLHQRKFLELARALAGRPRLVLLDEVLSGLTPSEMNEAVALIRKIRDRGATIVFVEHVMSAVMALTDRIAVFNQGKLLAVGLGEEVMSNPAVVSAYLGKELDKEKKTEQGHA